MNSPALPAGLRAVAPVFSTGDLDRWITHYRSLGFTVEAHDQTYAFARLDNVEVHVSVNPDHDPLHTAGCAYLSVDDADALHQRWAAVAHEGKDVAPVGTDYSTREGAHLDPDNNLLRYGTPDPQRQAVSETARPHWSPNWPPPTRSRPCLWSTCSPGS